MLFFLVAACGQRGPDVVPGVSLQLAQHRAKITSDLNYQLRLDIPGNKDEAIDGSVSISFVLADASAPLQLDFRESADKVVNVVTNGAVSAYRFEHEHIVIPAAELAAAENLIEIEFTAGATSLNRNLDYLYTLFVPDRARTAFPLFDQPDLKATFELTLGVPAGWTAMSNGPIETVIQHDATTEYRFARSDLISSYLFSFVAGKFETITAERNGRSMTLLHRERNPDSKRKLEFLKPSLSADQSERDAFFESLAQKERREVESWVLDALRNLHHPLRTDVSEHYLRPSLELLQEIQITGDIFFPKHWLDLTLGNYRSATAVRSVRIFLDERPDYNEQLRMKILQSADMVFRANAILSAGVTD